LARRSSYNRVIPPADAFVGGGGGESERGASHLKQLFGTT